MLVEIALKALANEAALTTRDCHSPPGTSKWNKIEHRVFSFISLNLRGRPLISHEVVVDLIANTRTSAGLDIQAELDRAAYPRAIKVTDEEATPCLQKT